MLTPRRALWHCLPPLLLAFVLYALFRTPDTIVNQVLLKLWPSKPGPFHLPYAQWVVYNLPGALWLYSFLWASTWSGRRWVSLFPLVLALGIELVQLLHITVGTFDPVDVMFYLVASLIFGVASGLLLPLPALATTPVQPVKRRYKFAFLFFVVIVVLSDVWVK